MSIYGDLLGYESIEIVSPYALQQLSELKIIRRINSHTVLRYTGIIPETQMDRYIQAATTKDRIEVNQKDISGTVKPLFKGLTADLGVKTVHGVYYLEVEAYSHSFELDVKLRNRSFQNSELKYSDLLNQIIAAYPDGQIKDQAGNGATLAQFTLQHQETDWQFLKRLASRFNAFLIPDDLAGKPQLYFGLASNGAAETVLSDDLPYRIGKDLVGYAEVSQNYLPSINDSDFTYYSVETGQYYPLGTTVKFKGRQLVVAESIAELKKGSLFYEYHLCPIGGLKQKPLFNRQIVGASLQGKVIETAKNNVRVHLEVDQQQDKNTAWWFPYSSFYTAEGNSGWYCMPQPGDYVQVYFPTVREEEAIATNSVRKDKESCQKTQDPGVKYWGTSHGKELMLGGNELTLTAKNSKAGQIRIKLNDDEGIEIRSDNEIYLAARQNLSFELDQKATIKAKEELQLICGESSIDMDGVTHLRGVEVSLEPQK